MMMHGTHDIRDYLGTTALRVGGTMLALTVAIGLFLPEAFFFAYLSAVVFWIGIPLGAGAFLLLHHLVGGGWGRPLRPLLSACVRTAPLIALLFLPLLAGIPWLYPWAHLPAASDLLVAKAGYLNTPFFTARTLGYLALWSLGALLIARSTRVDAAQSEQNERFSPRLGAIGLIVYVLSASFAGIDWIGSLEPTWYSSIFGLYVVIGQAVAGLAVVVILQKLWNSAQGSDQRVEALHDAGNLLLTVVVLHAYFGFSQFLIIWNGNLPHEIGWFAERIRGGWGLVALGIILFHFAIPFAALLARQVKRTERALVRVAGLLVFACIVDTVWMVLPSYSGSAVVALFLAITATVGIGGLWIWLFDRMRRTGSGIAAVREAAI